MPLDSYMQMRILTRRPKPFYVPNFTPPTSTSNGALSVHREDISEDELGCRAPHAFHKRSRASLTYASSERWAPTFAKADSASAPQRSSQRVPHPSTQLAPSAVGCETVSSPGICAPRRSTGWPCPCPNTATRLPSGHRRQNAAPRCGPSGQARNTPTNSLENEQNLLLHGCVCVNGGGGGGGRGLLHTRGGA